jgi:Uncharacterized enzyme involved in biosynthesis of extracellular polysaccharides
MINVGINYKVKKGREIEFEERFREVVRHVGNSGMLEAKIYKNVEDPSDYLIITKWESLESFRKFINSLDYKETVEYGKSILEKRPVHFVLGEK